MVKNILILSVLLSVSCWSQSQLPVFQFKTISTNDGLSNRSITAITEDSNGQIWIGTADGLNRLDGYRIKNFYYNPTTSKGVCNNTISVFNNSIPKQLWMGTASGVCYFDSKKNQFVLPDSKHKTNLNKEFFPHLLKCKNTFWVFGNTSMYNFTDATHVTENKYQFNPKTNRSVRRYFDATLDSNNRIWANNANYLLELDSKTMLPKQELYIGNQPNDGITKITPTTLYFWSKSDHYSRYCTLQRKFCNSRN
jgi:ligand-binding sensor domain-containing protein